MFRYKEVRFFRPLAEVKAFHFYLLQFFGGLYMTYRLLSRDYTFIGFFTQVDQIYLRGLFHEYFPIPVSYFTTFQFIYELIPFPNTFAIEIIQLIIVASSVFLTIGILPKLFSIISFLLYLHLLGLMQSLDNEIDGGTLLIVLFFILSLSPKSFFYKIGNCRPKKTQLNWPVFLLFLFVGSYYSLAGINKIIDVGVGFPFSLDLEKWNLFATQNSIFTSIRDYVPEFTSHPLMMSSLFSDLSGIITLIVELFFVGILFLPRYRFFLIISMIIMHILVYYTHAINFLGSSIILLLCFDWNIFFREINLIYDDDCGFCKKSLRVVKRFDFFDKIRLTPSYKIKTNQFGIDNGRLLDEIGGVDENSEIFYGADAFEQVFSRIFVFWPIAILMKIPFVIYIARSIYKLIALNRSRLSDEGCEI